MRVCARACVSQPLSFLTIKSGEGFIGLTLNAGKREIYGFDRKKREEEGERKGGGE